MILAKKDNTQTKYFQTYPGKHCVFFMGWFAVMCYITIVLLLVILLCLEQTVSSRWTITGVQVGEIQWLGKLNHCLQISVLVSPR